MRLLLLKMSVKEIDTRYMGISFVLNLNTPWSLHYSMMSGENEIHNINWCILVKFSMLKFAGRILLKTNKVTTNRPIVTCTKHPPPLPQIKTNKQNKTKQSQHTTIKNNWTPILYRDMDRKEMDVVNINWKSTTEDTGGKDSVIIY